MTLLARSMPATEIRTIASSGPSSGRVSATFHGRDIFAPAAARLACGLPLRSIGPEQTSLVEIPIPGPSRNPSGGIQGQVIHVDRFGNLITNISRGFVEEERPAGPPREALIGDGKRIGLRDHYGEVPKGEPLALWGSSDLLELAANQGHAAKLLGLTVGAGVTLRVVPPAKGQGSM
jgi:S-adenosylmethionine hydrolase